MMGIIMLNVLALSINDIQHNDTRHNSNVSSYIMLSVVMLSAVILSVMVSPFLCNLVILGSNFGHLSLRSVVTSPSKLFWLNQVLVCQILFAALVYVKIF